MTKTDKNPKPRRISALNRNLASEKNIVITSLIGSVAIYAFVPPAIGLLPIFSLLFGVGLFIQALLLEKIPSIRAAVGWYLILTFLSALTLHFYHKIHYDPFHALLAQLVTAIIWICTIVSARKQLKGLVAANVPTDIAVKLMLSCIAIIVAFNFLGSIVNENTCNSSRCRPGRIIIGSNDETFAIYWFTTIFCTGSVALVLIVILDRISEFRRK